MNRKQVRGIVAWEKYLDEGGRVIVARDDCSIEIRHERFCDVGKRGTIGTEPCCCAPLFDVMWRGDEQVEENTEARG